MKRIIVDVDTGLDDAQALMMALSLPATDVQIVAITCVCGNTNVQQVCVNTLKVLSVYNQDKKIPIFKGMHKPIMSKRREWGHHGYNGLGDVPDSDTPDESLIQKEHAVQALIRIINENPGELTLVALGPLTNIAMALRLDPDLGKKLCHTVIMGGNIEGRGNMITAAETNFFCDPEAAHIVLNELGSTIQLLPWEPCLKYGLDWDWYESIQNKETSAARFHHRINQKRIPFMKERKHERYSSCDAWAMAIALRPLTITESGAYYCSVELRGDLTRGQMVVDWAHRLGKEKNIEVVTGLDMTIIQGLYENIMS